MTAPVVWEDPDPARWLRLHRLNERNREACEQLERARRGLDRVEGAIERRELSVLTVTS